MSQEGRKRFRWRPWVIWPSALFILLVLFANACTFRISDAVARKEFSEAGIPVRIETARFGHRKLHYVVTGADTAATIVFVHGSPGSWDAFKGYLEDKDLREKFRLISIDRPGFGHSDFGSALPLQAEADIISTWMKGMRNGRPMHLVGHSLGGPLVALLATDTSNEVDHLVILAGSIDPSLEPHEPWRHILGVFPLDHLLPGAFRPSNKEILYLKSDLVDLAPRLSQIRCDVYVMHGKKDMLVDVRNVDYIKKMFTHAASVADTLFPEENHFIPWTQFNTIKKELLSLPTQ